MEKHIPKTALEYFKNERNKHTEPYRPFYDEAIDALEKRAISNEDQKKKILVVFSGKTRKKETLTGRMALNTTYRLPLTISAINDIEKDIAEMTNYRDIILLNYMELGDETEYAHIIEETRKGENENG